MDRGIRPHVCSRGALRPAAAKRVNRCASRADAVVCVSVRCLRQSRHWTGRTERPLTLYSVEKLAGSSLG